MTTHHAQTLINPNCYNYIIPKNDTLHENIEMFIENGYSPILIEFGLKAMNSYFEEVFNGAKNRIDTLVLSKFYGQL